MIKGEKITDYDKEIHESNKFYHINGTNLENGFNIYKDSDDRPFFNLLSTRVFPTELAPYSYIEFKTTGGETLQNISWAFYETIRLWWVIAEANHIQDPFKIFIPGQMIKVPIKATISDILATMKK